ncbi:MAG: alpha,alpha-trehalase TreF [Lewinellaceae bacterium]|nr:alpha,alpha-trehalase TreF [Saprospiraceae bacterium]MCB9336530.1 alpha,alpha-trehalase TreF [Lewinellaceae bacterium]
MTEPHDKVFGELFVAVQKSGVFPDSKTFVDCVPKQEPEEILAAYQKAKSQANFDLYHFVEQHFEKPKPPTTNFTADPNRPVDEHIELLWDVLTRDADRAVPGSSLIPLPHPYIVPGGRFGEIYYWDSYFTMLGLQASGRVEMIKHMVDNFSFLINTVGFIPNGNRTYFLGRSQPPFYSLMVSLLADEMGEGVLKEYLPFLEKEYAFWMAGSEELEERNPATLRVVRLEEGVVLNRYWDNRPMPREESWREDVELAEGTRREPTQLYRDLRAGCESGWDFSTRWFRDGKSLATIRTTELIPVDLNALLYHLELTIARAHKLAGNDSDWRLFQQKAETRKEALLHICWDKASGQFFDDDFAKHKRTGIPSAATAFPLFFSMASEKQAAETAHFIEKNLLRPGGIVTSPIRSGQQWDAPNGWAPLQWVAIAGLRNYGFEKLAATIRSRWVDLNQKVYRNTGKMMEKYNVEDMGLDAGGGEYPVQDGFGWSNGVLLKLLKE